MYKREITRIPVTLETRAKLKDLGKKGETYDAVIRRLIEKGEAGAADAR